MKSSVDTAAVDEIKVAESRAVRRGLPVRPLTRQGLAALPEDRKWLEGWGTCGRSIG